MAAGDRKGARGLGRVWLITVMVWLAALCAGLGVVWLQIESDRQQRRQQAMAVAGTQANLLHSRIDSALSSTYALAAVLRHHNYVVHQGEFEVFASELLKYHPGIVSLQYAPRGIVTYIVPLKGNEEAIGHNLFDATEPYAEGLQAVRRRTLMIGGPFALAQGGSGLVGRLPIFRRVAGAADEEFWGFAAALVKVDDLLNAAEMAKLQREGYDHELWRVLPDSGQRYVFSRSKPTALDDPVVFNFEVPNGTWFLSLQPRDGWLADHHPLHSAIVVAAFVFASLMAAVVFVLVRQPLLLREQVERRTRELAEQIRVRRDAEAQLRLAARVFESSAEAIMITDAAEHIVSVNAAFTAITGYSAEEAIGQTPAIIASGRHDVPFFAAIRRELMAGGHWQGEIWNRRKNGEIFPQWLGISVLFGEAGEVTHYVSISADISERKAAEERIDYLAHYDVLTGLPNRMLLRDRLLQAMHHADRSQTKVSVLSLDLDRFKIINETLGHELGDILLQQVVLRLKDVVRGSDTVSRQGGDEFIIVAPDQEGASIAARIALKIQDRLAAPFLVDGHEVRVTSSIGIVLYPDDGTDFETLLKKCDIAMYHAKESGRATYRFFADATHENTAERLQIESELSRAVERQEFVLYYQPQIELGSDTVIGAEALIRWQHPEKGLIPPGRFIALAEETGLIIPIGDWALREACRQIRAWQDAGLPPILVSVNLSGLQFRRPGLVVRVAEILAATGVAPRYLELELTESILVHDAEHVLQTVRELKALGVKLAIDDFGTGYSSLSYLKRFAVDKLKIDQSFIRDICSDPEDAAIVLAVIQLGRSLNLQIIAEGAETAEQVQRLRDHGCLQVQGYFYSRPLPAAEFVAFAHAPTPSAEAGKPA